jgi:hypothetical protein
MLRRRLLGVLSVLSLILCGATVVLWVRSYRCGDMIRYAGPWGGTGVTSFLGAIHLPIYPPWPSNDVGARDTAPAGWQCESWPISEPAEGWGPFYPPEDHAFAGFGVVRSYREISADGRLMPWRHRVFVVPDWFVAGLFIAPVVMGLKVWRSFRTAKPGLCPACGYDSRATPGRCPECNWREAGGDAK